MHNMSDLLGVQIEEVNANVCPFCGKLLKEPVIEGMHERCYEQFGDELALLDQEPG